jgi:hypothetical protein
MKKGKFIGHCQACGAQQVVNPVMIGLAKHGYKVAGFGFFNGICQGTTHDALELSRAYLDATVVALGEYAERADTAAAELRSGAKAPATVTKLNQYGVTQWLPRTSHYAAREIATVSWADASQIERAKGLELAIDSEQSQARQARAHAKGLLELAARVHGAQLKARKVEAAPISAGDTVRLFGKSGFDVEVLEIVGKVAQGCGPALNGHHMPHITFKRENGTIGYYPVRLIRRPKAGA